MLLRCYATIADWMNATFGTDIALPLHSFGFFVALAFLVGAWFLRLELRRRDRIGQLAPLSRTIIEGRPPQTKDIAVNAIVGFILGFKLVGMLFNYSACVRDPQGFLLSAEGVLWGGLVGAVVMAGWRYRAVKAKVLPKPVEKEITHRPGDWVGEILIRAAIGGIVGAKLFNFFEDPEDFQRFLENPGANFFSGLTIYGGLIVGAGAVIWWARKNKINIGHLADATAPALMISYAIGRIGCQVSGDGDWGINNTAAAPSWMPEWLWSQKYAHNILGRGEAIPGCTEDYCSVLEVGVFPTPLYETLACLLLFGVLWSLRTRWKIPGMLMGLYVLMNGLERFFIEKIRINAEFEWQGITFTQAELISSLLMLLGLGLMIWLKLKSRKSKETLSTL